MDIVQLVERLIWDQEVARSSRVIPITLSYSGEKNVRKEWITIKEISKNDLQTLIENGIIGHTHTTNDNSYGRHSCGYYDIKKFRKGKKEHRGDKKHLKTFYAHIGVSITRNHIYIEDKYVDMVNKIK